MGEEEVAQGYIPIAGALTEQQASSSVSGRRLRTYSASYKLELACPVGHFRLSLNGQYTVHTQHKGHSKHLRSTRAKRLGLVGNFRSYSAPHERDVEAK